MGNKSFWAEIADISFEIHYYHNEAREMYRDYEIEKTETSNIIAISLDEIEKCIKDNPQFSDGYNEGACIYREIAKMLPNYNGVLMHGAAISYEESGFIFTAPSGTGKTTHISLWMKHLGEKVDMVNGDKPIVRIIDDEIFVCGTPWGGKENWQKNRKVLLKGICFINQGVENRIEPIESKAAVEKIMSQIFLPNDPLAAVMTLDLLDRIMTKVPMYVLYCDMSKDAVKCSFEKMTGLRMD